MPTTRAPRRGSMAYSPRKRAKSISGRIRFWPDVEEGPRLLGFAGYKAGMTHVFVIEDRERSPDYGKEVRCAATVLETPPMLICGVRAYEKTVDGLKALTEVWMENPPEDLKRRIKTLRGGSPEEGFKLLEENIDRIAELRVIAATQPRLASVPKKKPELMEIKIGGGTREEQLEYARELLGKTIRINDVFKPGEAVDVIGVTKGKGFQGPVKRWGVKILSHKSRKKRRDVGTLGPWHPARVMPTVPRAGQMGFHNRTEYNKRILLIGEDGEKVTPKGGFTRYGVIRTDYVLLKGSVMGPPKRLIKLRKAVRPPHFPEEPPKITYIHRGSVEGEGG